MELRRYLAIVRRWWWLLVLGTLLGGGLAFLVTLTQTPIYQATATALVNTSQSVTGPTYNDIIANQQLTKTYGRLVASGPVLEQVGQQFDLSYDQLKGMVSVSAGRDTQLIDISVRNGDPELAAAIANETARVFADQIRQSQLGQQGTVESDIEKQLTALQVTIDQQQQLVTRLRTEPSALSDPQRSQQVAEAQAQLDSLRQNQLGLQRQLQDVRISLAKSINSVTLADPARVPQNPASPRTLLITALGAIFGLLVVAGVVVVAEYLDDTVKTAEDVEQAAGAPSLGIVPRFDVRRGLLAGRRAPAPRLVTNLGGRSPIAEAYRMVRTNLEFARSNRTGQTILVTSALPGEGKTTTAANLSLVLADSGLRVILVDADLRKRSLDQLFGLTDVAGLSTLFVMGRPELSGLLRPTQHENLRLLAAGPAPPNPAELLASARMGEIVARLKAEADIVVFDSPPLLSVADSAGVAPMLDGVVMVVDSGRTRRGALAQAVEILDRAHATLWGVVLNKLKRPRGGDYYGTYFSEAAERPPSTSADGVSKRSRAMSEPVTAGGRTPGRPTR